MIVAVLYARTRFGFEVKVIGDSPRAASYAGMRTRRKILAVMALSGALAGIGGASQDGDFRHQLDPRGLTAAGYGYAGIVIAALARYNPFAVVLVAFLLGGLQNAGYALQGVDFPSGLVGVMEGLILFCALGGELLVRYRLRLVRPARRARGGLGDARVNNSIGVFVLASAVAYGTPLLFAALGELLAERSGVLNLGVEGMMLIGAVAGLLGGAAAAGLGAGCARAARSSSRRVAGALMALIHAFLVITLRSNQIVSGLALTIFGLRPLVVPRQRPRARRTRRPSTLHARSCRSGMRDAPVVGPILFDQNALVYVSWVCVIVCAWYLARTRPGLNVRAVGESPAAADAMGINVTGYRYAHTLVGGAFAGVGGATFSLAITPRGSTA